MEGIATSGFALLAMTFCFEGCIEMINSTLCYVTQGNEVLMLHRVKKKNDINKDKWIGIGGKFEENESPDECLLREAREETGLELTSWRFCVFKVQRVKGGA